MLTTEQKTKLAIKAFNSIKKSITEQKKTLKERPADSYWGQRYPTLTLDITMKEGWTGAKNEKYRLTANWNMRDEKHLIETDTRSELEDVINNLFGLLNKQMQVKGWTTLKVVRDKATFGDAYYGVKVIYPSRITLCDAPCKEFKSLQSFIKRYGNYNLYNFEIFHSRMGGKRGYLWDEYGERMYLDNRPKKCSQVLDELRKHRGSKDIMICKAGEENYIDPIDQRYSEMHEVECDGEKRHYLEITIKTPTGKVKYQKKIY